MSELRRPDACPVCAGPRILRILYGRPLPEAIALVERGEALLGGCIVLAGQPDWECSRCRHRWHDPQDPMRQKMDAVLEELASRQFSPPVPELRLRADGLRERVWNAKMKARTSPVSEEFSSQLRDRALKQYRQCLTDQNAEGVGADGTLLDVRAEVAGPRFYRVVIARGGAAPNWDMAADTWVMHALEAMAGPIVAWEGVPRALWKLWPLPPAPPVAGQQKIS
ncbi:MAG TPA: hypothetical protein VL242_53395 [Sorangium sp.]|nr:hypothetical protein [Sorangium sp.]